MQSDYEKKPKEFRIYESKFIKKIRNPINFVKKSYKKFLKGNNKRFSSKFVKRISKFVKQIGKT